MRPELSNLPLVMLADKVTLSRRLEKQYPGRLGCLFSPYTYKKPHGLPFALDNGKFPVWSAGKEWDANDFVRHLDQYAKVDYLPRWIVVPDVVADPVGTVQEWRAWAKKVEKYGPLAVAVQDGMTPLDVTALRPLPEVVFVGGTTRWKWKSLPMWTRNFPRVHVGRVNSERLLWIAHRVGAESTDGTGWTRATEQGKRFMGLPRYLRRSSAGKGERDAIGFFSHEEGSL